MAKSECTHGKLYAEFRVRVPIEHNSATEIHKACTLIRSDLREAVKSDGVIIVDTIDVFQQEYDNATG